jgi:hypothetical protein
MTEFETVLQECLQDLERGVSSVQECLRRHPEYADQLEPMLFASARLERAGQARLSEGFKARVRDRLMQDMYAYPRVLRTRPIGARFGFVFARLAVGLAVVLLALLVTGTAYAQNTLPGDTFYGWKLASEDAWRTVSSDPVGTELAIAERRVAELVVVKDDPALRAQTLEAYAETVNRLRSQTDAHDPTYITRRLDSQMERLKKLGILLSQVDPATLPSDEPIPLGTQTPLILQTPHVEPSELPQVTPAISSPPKVVPTVKFPPEVIPTVEIQPELVPTFEIPPPIR